MKNQYFGDRTDLFKYDLIAHIVEQMRPYQMQNFAYIPMLTRNDNKGHGSLINFKYAKTGYENDKLVAFLKLFHKIHKDQKDFREIKNYFEKVKINTEIYEYESGKFFSKQNRSSYFRSIDKKLLKKSLIFLDPDNGMEVKNSSEKHVLYSEIERLYNDMDSHSVLMVIQFKKTIDTKEYWKNSLRKRTELLFEKLKLYYLPIFISDYQIGFFILSKNVKTKFKVMQILHSYQNLYPKLLIDSASAI